MDYFPSYLQHVFDIPLLVLLPDDLAQLWSHSMYGIISSLELISDDVKEDVIQKINHTFNQAFGS